MITYIHTCTTAALSFLLVNVALCASSGKASATETQVQNMSSAHPMHRLPYARKLSRETGYDSVSRYLGISVSRYLGISVSRGSDVNFEVPSLGVFCGPNLTPDKETALGNWTEEQIATAITTGKRPDGRILAPPMPVASFKHLTKSDGIGDCRLSQDLATHQAQGSWAIWAKRKTDFIRLPSASAEQIRSHTASG
jgi:hypothetical protein